MTTRTAAAPLAADATARYDVVYFPLGAGALGGAERARLELAAAGPAAGSGREGL
jgi:hypothetical protein